MYTHRCAQAHTGAHRCTQACMRMHAHARACVHASVHLHIHVHTHAHMHAHMHAIINNIDKACFENRILLKYRKYNEKSTENHKRQNFHCTKI